MNNLPYDLVDTSEILAFLGYSYCNQVFVSLILKDGNPSGRGQIIVSTADIAYAIVKKHGHTLRDRSVYMNLDGFFGRGKMYTKMLEPRKPKSRRPKKLVGEMGKQSKNVTKKKPPCRTRGSGRQGKTV